MDRKSFAFSDCSFAILGRVLAGAAGEVIAERVGTSYWAVDWEQRLTGTVEIAERTERREVEWRCGGVFSCGINFAPSTKCDRRNDGDGIVGVAFDAAQGDATSFGVGVRRFEGHLPGLGSGGGTKRG